MSPAQQRLYFRAWAATRAVLRSRGLSPADADARRHALHVEALGAAKSSKDFTNRDLDLVLAAFSRVRTGEAPDLPAQVGELKRRHYVLRQRLASLDEEKAYAQAIATRMGLGLLDSLRFHELDKVLAALRKEQQRRARQAKSADPF